MSIEAVPFKPYTGPIDTGSKRYQTAKAMMEEGKAAGRICLTWRCGSTFGTTV